MSALPANRPTELTVSTSLKPPLRFQVVPSVDHSCVNWSPLRVTLRYRGTEDAPLKMTCAQTASLYVWEREVVAPAAEAILGEEVDRILSYGSFSCRNIAGASRLSEHGRANAIDIRGFRLADGRVRRSRPPGATGRTRAPAPLRAKYVD